MPFVEERRIPQPVVNIQPPDTPDVVDPTLGETFGAAFRTQNTVASFAASRGMADPYEIEDGFDAIDYVKDDAEFSPYVEEFAGIFNKKAAEAKKAQIRRELADNRTLQAAGGMGIAASIAAGVVDLPTFLIPGGVVTAGARVTGSMALGVAAGAALDAGVSEAALHATQATRTTEETVLNIGGSIVVGGALGALVGRYMRPADVASLSRKVEGQEKAFDEFDQAFVNTGKTSAGAAARDTGPLTLKDEALIQRLPIANRQDPLIRSQLSPLDSTRQTVRGLAETPLEYAENAKGVATEKGGSVETRIKMWNAPLAKGVREIDTIYARYFHGTPEPSAWQRRLSPTLSEFDRRFKGGQKLTYKEFKEEVGRAAYMGEAHEIPEVAQAAKIYREFDEQLKKAAIDARLFPEDVDVAGDISHRFRVYNREMIIARRNDFSARLEDYFLSGQEVAQQRVAESEAARLSIRVEEASKEVAKLDTRLASIEKRINEKTQAYEATLNRGTGKKIGVTEKQFEDLQRRRGALEELTSDYRAVEAMHKEASARYKVLEDEFKALPKEVADTPNVKMALDYVRAHKAKADLNAQVTRLKQREKALRLSQQRAKADDVARKVNAAEADLARHTQTVNRLSEAFKKIGKFYTEQGIAKTEEFARLMPDEIKDLVNEVIDTILGNAEGRIPYDIVAGPRGALKERVLKIESAKIHEFLENDIEQVMRMQLRTMAPDVELAKKFGSVDMKEQIRQINDEANRKIAEAKTDKERKALDAARKKSVQDIEGIRDRLRGTYAMPSDPASLVVRANRVARNLNYVRLLGGMTVSAIPDMGKIVYTHGLTSTFRDGFLPLMKNLHRLSSSKVAMAADEVRTAGTALDMVLDSRTMALADITDDFGRHSKLERGLGALSSKFGVISLMAPWNAAMKQFSGIVTMTNLLRASERVAKGKASKAEIRKLASAGIDADLAQRITRQFAEHGDKGDVWLAQTGAWTDKEAIEAFRSAVVRDVDRIVVTPGQDKPLWMSTELGKTISQFKSFAVSSMQRTFLAGLQQRDAATLNGTLVMLGLGAMTYALKEKVAGRETSDKPSVWAVNAFDRSGLTGWLMEGNNLLEKATRGQVGASFFTGEQVSRYASRNIYGAFLGPSADAVADIFQVSGSIFAGDSTKSDLRKARRMIPMQNLFYARWLFNSVEEGAGDALNLPDTSR